MPELPEVETMVRGVRHRLEGMRLLDLKDCGCLCKPILLQPGLEELRGRVAGERIEAVTRRAKRILIRMGNHETFVIEPRMTGLMLVDAPPSQEHLRLEWVISQGRRRHSVWFWDRRGLGTVRLLSLSQLEETLEKNLGPDALEISPLLWAERLRTARPIKVALLDQKLVAGIGNLYASEILHRAGIHPERAANSLTPKQTLKLHESTLEILHTAIRYEGSTLSDGTYRNALNKAGGYQNEHRVYGKQDETCPTCRRGTIRRIVQAQRSTFYCPRCQR